jgi:hypothetical protein
MPRRFTLGEAQRLLPEVGRLLREGVSLRSRHREAQERFQALSEHIRMMGGSIVDRPNAVETRTKLDESSAMLRNVIESIQETGCTLKDLDTGLLDFPSLYRGREVYLCWKLGEPDIAFWHGVEEGFAGRKPIDQDFLDHHEGD